MDEPVSGSTAYSVLLATEYRCFQSEDGVPSCIRRSMACDFKSMTAICDRSLVASYSLKLAPVSGVPGACPHAATRTTTQAMVRRLRMLFTSHSIHRWARLGSKLPE